jgi:hypothetical protein
MPSDGIGLALGSGRLLRRCLVDLLAQLDAELLFKSVIFETARSGASHALREAWRRDCGEHRPSHSRC